MREENENVHVFIMLRSCLGNLQVFIGYLEYFFVNCISYLLDAQVPRLVTIRKYRLRNKTGLRLHKTW